MESPQLKNCLVVGGASSSAGGNVRRHFDAVAVDSTISGICRFLRSLGIHSGEYVTQILQAKPVQLFLALPSSFR